MARADLLCDLIKSGVAGESIAFRKAAEAICAEERAKQHEVLAKKIEDILKSSNSLFQRKEPQGQICLKKLLQNVVWISFSWMIPLSNLLMN